MHCSKIAHNVLDYLLPQCEGLGSKDKHPDGDKSNYTQLAVLFIPVPYQAEKYLKNASLVAVNPCNTVDTPNFRIGCNRMLGVSPNYRANGSITSNTSVLLASRREFLNRL